MAEYIDRKQIKYCRERVLNHWSGSRHTDCDVKYKDIVTKQNIDSIPTADVVERSKIDKAIAEIEQLDFIRGENEIFVNKDFVLKILKEI